MSQRCNNCEGVWGGSYKCRTGQRYAKITASLPAHAVKFYSAELTNKSSFRRLSMGSNWSVYKADHITLRCSVIRRGSVLTAVWWNQSSCYKWIRHHPRAQTWRIKEHASVVACFASPLIFFRTHDNSGAPFSRSPTAETVHCLMTSNLLCHAGLDTHQGKNRTVLQVLLTGSEDSSLMHRAYLY